MKHLKTYEGYKNASINNDDTWYVVNNKTKQVIAYNQSYFGKNEFVYGEDGKRISDDIVYGGQSISGKQVVFDSLEDAQKWIDDREEALNLKKLSKIPKNDLGKKLYEISEYVRKTYPNINRGTCYFFTYLISKYFKEVTEFILIEEENEEVPIHMMCKIGKVYYDGKGFHKPSEVISDYETTKDRIFIVDRSEVEYWNDRMDYATVNSALSTIPLTPEERIDLEDYIKKASKI